MRTDRPMSEYESALHTSIQIAFRAIFRLGADREEIVRELQAARKDAATMGSRNAAATIGMLMRSFDWPPYS
jgi:hypothetical protein